MDKPKTTPKDFFLWAGAMVAFYWSIVSFLSLIFDYINYAFPNPLSYFPADPYQSGISYEMASLIVLFPLFVILMRFIRRDMIADPSRAQIWVRRWAIFLTLFVAGVAIAGDLIWLLTAFLNGTDITMAFFLKAAVVFLVAAVVFMHFIADYWGYWQQYPQRAYSVGYATTALILASIVAGFFVVGTPMQAKLARLDAQKVNDLQSIQSQIIYYWQAKQKLPTNLNDLNDSLSYYTVPMDQQTGAAYEYEINAARSFSLCATFNTDSNGRNTQPNMAIPVRPDLPGVYGGKMGDSWQHGAGRTCFLRTIDPELYPPNTTPTKPLL